MTDTPRFCKQPFDYYAVVDFECTCQEDTSNYVHEIIEFPVVLVDAIKGEVVDRFHSYVRPTEQPQLSRFCMDFTGISQATVDSAPTLDRVLEMFDEWIADRQLFPVGSSAVIGHEGSFSSFSSVRSLHFGMKTLPEKKKGKKSAFPASPSSLSSSPSSSSSLSYDPRKTVVLATDGPWDIEKFLADETRRKGIALPAYYHEWVDLRTHFSRFYGCSRRGITSMLRDVGLTFVGQPHSGIDDAFNIARIASVLMEDGCVCFVNDFLFNTHPRQSYGGRVDWQSQILLKHQIQPQIDWNQQRSLVGVDSQGSLQQHQLSQSDLKKKRKKRGRTDPRPQYNPHLVSLL